MGATMSEKTPEILDEFEDAQTRSILASLRKAEPPREVQQRIVERAMARVSKPRFLIRGLEWGLTAAAAAIAIGVGLHLWSPASNNAPLTGSVHAAKESPTSFRVGSHEVLLSPSSEVEVTAAEGELIELFVASGAATFDVAPLDEGEIFRVRTEHVLVEVVGTRFSVHSERHCSLVTVEEGLVRVSDAEGGSFLLEPNRGRRFCSRGSSDSLLRQALVLISGGGSVEKAIELLETYLDSAPGSNLEEEALYHLSLAYARLGQTEEANRLAEEFRQRFPESSRLERLERGLATLRSDP